MPLGIKSINGYEVYVRYWNLIHIIKDMSSFTTLDLKDKLDVPKGSIYNMLKVLKFANVIKVVGYTQTKGTSYKIFQYIGKKENDDVNV